MPVIIEWMINEQEFDRRLLTGMASSMSKNVISWFLWPTQKDAPFYMVRTLHFDNDEEKWPVGMKIWGSKKSRQTFSNSFVATAMIVIRFFHHLATVPFSHERIKWKDENARLVFVFSHR